MENLPWPHKFCLSSASGWLDLGNPREAWKELDQLPEEWRGHPDALELEWLLWARDSQWAQALHTADRLLQTKPDRASGWIHKAYALRRLKESGGLQAARETLTAAYEQFPKEPVIPYNLACYACQDGDLDRALGWLKEAFKQGDRPSIQSMALNDDDLKPLWPAIKNWKE